jgi:AraC-like DNA-binding protein
MGVGRPPRDVERPGSDTLSDVLQAVRLNGALFFLVDARSPWTAEAPATQILAPAILPQAQHVVSYHVVTTGHCWCRVADAAPVHVEAGDVVVIPHGDQYELTTERGGGSAMPPDETVAWFRAMASGQMPFVVREGGNGPERLGVVCGFLGCDVRPFNPVLAALPTVVHVRPPAGPGPDRLTDLIDFAVAEAEGKRAGSRSVLLRLAELLFVEVVRRYLMALPAEERGWLVGLRDDVVGPALALLHKQPEAPWTLDGLAREVAASRSVLAERFTHFVGQPPMQYLTRWRMQLAAQMLSGGRKVAAVGRDVGYESEAAFSRAFKKATGLPPRAWRHRQAT